jgi:hypothetical protein
VDQYRLNFLLKTKKKTYLLLNTLNYKKCIQNKSSVLKRNQFNFKTTKQKKQNTSFNYSAIRIFF